jgi:hypothetical protein
MPQQQRRPRSSPLRAQWLAWCCAISLLALQGLGLWHRTVHVPALAKTVQLAALVAGESLGHKIGSADCQLFDQFTQFDLLCATAAPALVFDAPAIPAVRAPAASALQRHWSRAARGPPALA